MHKKHRENTRRAHRETQRAHRERTDTHITHIKNAQHLRRERIENTQTIHTENTPVSHNVRAYNAHRSPINTALARTDHPTKLEPDFPDGARNRLHGRNATTSIPSTKYSTATTSSLVL